jgi:hypothetical protein
VGPEAVIGRAGWRSPNTLSRFGGVKAGQDASFERIRVHVCPALLTTASRWPYNVS